jgi:pimeloyl-ACP methyl ester carboxylesterase
MTVHNKPRKFTFVVLAIQGFNWLFRNLVLAASLWIFYSRFYIQHRVPVGPPVAAKRKELESEAAGRLSYYFTSGKGRPLVLVHSVNAAASAFEMGPLLRHYEGNRPVFALDLPGFGFSDRSQRVYTPELYAAALGEFLEKVVKKPADVVALSLGSEFCARISVEKPALFHSLALISPSGMTQAGSASRQAGQAGASQKIYNLLAAPLWARPLFDLIATRVSIRYFLQQSFVGPVPEEFIDYAYAAAHQPGAEIAPLYFISGALFTPNAIEELYRKVTIPALVIYDQDNFTRFEGLVSLLEFPSRWQAARIVPSRGLPQFEKLAETVKALEEFWAGISVK